MLKLQWLVLRIPGASVPDLKVVGCVVSTMQGCLLNQFLTL